MKIAFRLGLTGFHPWTEDGISEREFRVITEQLRSRKGLADEVCLFTESWHHGYVSPEHIETAAALMEKRIRLLRQAGVPSVGINVLETVGQLDEGWDWLDPVPFQTMVGHDGQTSRGMMCIRGEAYRQYIREKYIRYARCGPDFIWLDDDIRPIRHGNIAYPCFCPKCMEDFNRRMHTSMSREELVTALNTPGSGALRSAWTEFIRDGMNELMRLIRDAVTGVDKNIRLGLMTIQLHGDTYGQADHSGLVRALGAEKLRPGEGFYDDHTPAGFAKKALYTADQVRECAFVNDRQYELEDFPGSGNKSVRMHIIELTAALFAGCNGAALNLHPAFDPDERPELSTDGLLQALQSHRAEWERLVRAGDEWRLYGGTAAFDLKFDAKYDANGDWFDGKARKCWEKEISFFPDGRAYTPWAENAAWAALSGEMASVTDDAALRRMLEKGLILDAGAVRRLCVRGYGPLIGCEPDREFASGMRETFTADPVNGAMAGRVRDVYQTFPRWNDGDVSVCSLRLLPGAVPLSSLSSITGVECGTASCAFENERGGRVICCGYLPWRLPDLTRRNEQIGCYVDWLCRGNAPLRLFRVNRMFPMYKRSPDRKGFMLLLVNCCLDATGDFEVRLDALPGGPLVRYDEQGDAHPFTDWETLPDGKGVLLRLPPMRAWEQTVILCE